jgi:hypothetical protein
MSRPDRPSERVRQRLPDISGDNRGRLGVPRRSNHRRQNDADADEINNNDQGEQESHLPYPNVVQPTTSMEREGRRFVPFIMARASVFLGPALRLLRNHSFDDALHLLSNQEDFMRRIIIGLSAIAITALPTMALADGDGALTGAAGGAVAGAVVGGPVGAAVGGVAGGVIGGAASGPAPVVVAPGPAPCNTRTTTTQNNNTGASVTRQTTDCAD